MRSALALIGLLLASLALSACGGAYPGFSSPRATLDTYFRSAEKLDYATTYGCYNRQYRGAVPQSDFTSRRRQAAVLKDYRIDNVSVNGDSARAQVSLTFASGVGPVGSGPTVAKVQEDLVRDSGSWKIKVW